MSILKDIKRPRRIAHVNLFFIELVIVLLFFSISGAVILRMFASADVISEKSSLSERAVMDIQSVSELYAIEGDLTGSVDKIYGIGRCTVGENGAVSVCLDEDMVPIMTDDVKKLNGRVEIFFTQNIERGLCGEMHELHSKAFLLADGGREIFSQVSTVYIPDFRKEGGV